MPTNHTVTEKKTQTDSSALRKNAASKGITHTSILASMKNKNGALKKLRSRYRQDKRELIAEAVEIGLKLQSAPANVWQQFMADPFWKDYPKARPKEGEQSGAVQFVARWYHGDNPRGAKLASEIWIAVEQLLQEKVPAADVPKALITGRSIRTLCDLSAERRKTEKPRKPTKAPPPKKTSGPGKAVTAPKAEFKSPLAKSTKAATAVKSKMPAEAKQVRVTLEAVFPKGTGEFLALSEGTSVKATFRIEKFGPVPVVTIKKLKVTDK